MDGHSEEETKGHWTAPDRWQAVIGVLGLLVAIVACVGQFVR
ncbi:hypothetical protein V1J52_22935 [Streptomyces sp. TRM 70351]|nr:hypothetical protein [Streptomyces sp. TRM 70351]MEE1930998.1 hypothetical protein [Streptomyces sp. TRM 70351]